MKIRLKTYNEIVSFFSKQRNTEEGGIIGGRTKDIIDYFYPDYAASKKTHNLYAPNINNLNYQLQIWKRKKISFLGIIHSHLTETPELSLSDKLYIEKIILLNRENRQLFFPIVLYVENNINILVYRVWTESKQGKIHFCKEDLVIVDYDSF